MTVPAFAADTAPPPALPTPFVQDISTPLRADLPVWPGDIPVGMTCSQTHEEGHGVQVTHLHLSAHTGTHLDAPRHFVPGGGLVTELDLNALIGPCQVVRYEGAGPITASFFADQNLPQPVPRLLLRCDINEGKLHEPDAAFWENYAAITPDAAQWMVENGVRLVGTDYLSIGPFASGNPEVHQILLGAGIIIVEGLDLRRIAAPGEYTLVCLPVALPCDGAPCRAVLLPKGALPEPLDKIAAAAV